MGTNRRLALIACIVALAAGACSGGGDSEAGGSGTTGNAAKAAVPATDGGGGRRLGYSAELDQSAVHAAVGDAIPPIGPRVIKTADVSVEVERSALQESIQKIVEVARGHGGFVLSTSVRDEGERRGVVVLRVPADHFETALADAEAIGEVTHEEVSGEDVGQEFVDLAARLRNFEAQETVLLRLMSRSTSVADTLRVQRELQDVQLEIERLRGRIRYLEDQTDLSTITVSLDEAGAAPAEESTIRRAWGVAVDTFNGIVSAVVIGLAILLPFSLLALLLVLLGRLVRARWPSLGSR
jgi:hypothetical protein